MSRSLKSLMDNRSSFGMISEPKRDRRKSSTTRFLPVRSRTEIIRHVACDLDFDMSIRRHSNSLETNPNFSEFSFYTAQPSIVDGGRAGKKVAFVFEAPAKSKDHISVSKEWLLHRGRRYTHEDVIESLMRKDDVLASPLPTFISTSISFSDDSSQHFDLLRTPTEPNLADDDTSSVSTNTENVYYEGELYRSGLPSLSHRLPQGSRSASKICSQQVSFGGHSSYLMDELWPWPWLDPTTRAKNLYVLTSSRLKTFSKQVYLPFLPWPSLEHTLDMYLQSVKPCVRDSQFQIIQKIVRDFGQGEGKIYQDFILNSDDPEMKGWIRHFIPNYYHRFSRQETVLLNTAIVAPFQGDLWPEHQGTQVQRAAILIALVTEFFQLIRTEKLVPITDSDGNAVCMHSFRKLFSTTKIPGIPADALVSYCLSDVDIANYPRHILLMYKGRIYTLQVLNANMKPLGQEEIKEYLQEMINVVDACEREEGIGLGVLTALDRNLWAKLRCDLIDFSANNSACMQDIEQALFVVSLDNTNVTSSNRVVHEAIFADGCNRWYDKSLSFYVYSNGLVTVNVNSAVLDGAIVAFLLHYMHLRIMEDAEKWDDDVVVAVSRRSSPAASHITLGLGDLLKKLESHLSLRSETVLIDKRKTSPPDKMDFLRALILDVDESLEIELDSAKQSFCELADQFSSATCTYEDYERGLFQTKKINMDALAHMILQLTFFRMYFRVAFAVSKVGLFRFHHQRYEYMRATTTESVAWCRLMLDSDASSEEKNAAFRAAERKHKQLLRENSSGQGCENHLAALRVIAEDVYDNTPTLFQEDSLCYSGGGSRFEIYAEGLGVGCPSCAAVLPRSRHGYGVGYSVVDTKVVFNVCCLVSETGLSAELFAINLRHTMKTLHPFLREL